MYQEKTDLFLFTNGILNLPFLNNEWTDKAVRWVKANCPSGFADKMEWFGGLILAKLLLGWRVRQMTGLLLAEQKHHRIHLVCHSFGCEIAVHALQGKEWLHIESLHLFAACCPSDFNVNGLNDAVLNIRVENIYVYMSHQDGALAAANIFGWQPHPLGLEGPKNVKEMVRNNVHVLERPASHCSWFDPPHFDDTMKMVVRDAKPEPRTTATV